MQIVEEFQPSISFWEVCPQLIAAGPTKKLYEEDKSKKKEESSKLMWFIALSTYVNSKYYNIPTIGEDNKYFTRYHVENSIVNYKILLLNGHYVNGMIKW